MNKASRPSGDPQFWRAIETAFGSTYPDDISDIGEYVASRGAPAVERFVGALEDSVSRLYEAGVPAALAQEARTNDGRRFADLPDADGKHALEAMLLPGKRFFEGLLDNPTLALGPKQLPLVDLRRAVNLAQDRPGISSSPLWAEREGDRRRDGSFWIEIHLAMGTGLGGPNARPWSSPYFAPRFRKVAMLASVDDSWRNWRNDRGVKTLDVWLEYSSPSDEPERAAVTGRGPATSVTIYRNVERLSSSDHPADIAWAEGHVALDLARTSVHAR